MVPAALIICAGIFLWMKHKPEQKPLTEMAPSTISDKIQSRGETLYKQKVYSPLIAIYENLVKKYPNNLDLKKKLAFAYFGAERYSDAKPILNDIAKTNVEDAEVYFELGVILQKEGDPNLAKENFDRSKQILEKNPLQK